MNNLFSSNEVQQYFDSLPASVQENIIQSGVQVESVEHLKQILQNIELKDQ